jgi:hypothetical protein
MIVKNFLLDIRFIKNMRRTSLSKYVCSGYSSEVTGTRYNEHINHPLKHTLKHHTLQQLQFCGEQMHCISELSQNFLGETGKTNKNYQFLTMSTRMNKIHIFLHIRTESNNL